MDPPAEEMPGAENGRQWHELLVVDLRRACRQRRLRVRGTKPQLVERLETYDSISDEMTVEKFDGLRVWLLRILIKVLMAITLEIFLYGINTFLLLGLRTAVLEYLVAARGWTREDVLWWTTYTSPLFRWAIIVNLYNIIHPYIDDGVYTYIARDGADWKSE